MIIGGCCHDHEHFGVNNVFLTETRHEWAIRYNDVSVLESHHVASSFKILQDPTFNCLKNFSKDDYKRIRGKMIACVLATDMSRHFADIGKFKSRTAAEDFEPAGKDKELVMTELFHLADISNPTKPWSLCRRWTDLLFAEFFSQGDQERDLGNTISYLMDRTIVNVAKSQLGFLDVIIAPAYSAASSILPLLEKNIFNIDSNKAEWEKLIPEYEEVMVAAKHKIYGS